MSVVTIRGQAGGGSPQIGRLVADRLHVDYVDREIIAKVAECVFRGKLAGVTEELGHPVGGKWPPSRSKLARLMKAP
jgi:hypothetical protein